MKMKMHFIINGFEESPSYFLRTGHFTWEQVKEMAENGKVFKIDGNSYSIELR